MNRPNNESWRLIADGHAMAQTLTQVGKYRIERELGHGAMGVVYKAFDPVVERRVALKTIRLDVDEAAELVHRLRREAKSVGQLEHPNIVTLYDAGEAGGLFYLAMQFIQGETLEARIARQRRFRLEEIYELFRQTCAGLDYAHQRGVIHRDIKPANIMITHEGVVKLTDFGIAKVAGAGASTYGLIVGTPSYMSPEQALGKPLDGRSDIFSLGSILYELLTGEKAFPGQNTTTVMYKIVYETPTPLRSFDPGLDPYMEAIVLMALAKDPVERFQSCAELAKALELYMNKALAPLTGASGAGATTVVPHAAAPPPPPSGQAAAAPAAARPEAALGGPSASPARQPTHANNAAVAPMPLPKHGPPWAWLAFGALATLLLVIVVLLVVQMRRPAPAPREAVGAGLKPAPTSPPPAPTEAVKETQPPSPAESTATEAVSPPPRKAPDLQSKPAVHPPAPARPKAAQKVSVAPPATTARAEAGPAVRGTAAPSATPGGKISGPTPTSNPPSQPAPAVPEDFNSLALKGDLAFQQGKYQDALNAYSKAYALNASNRTVRRKIAVTLTLLGRPDEAQKYK